MTSLKRCSKHATAAALAIAVVLCAWPAVRGQDLAFAPDATPKTLLADQFAILAIQTLGGAEAPRDDQLTRARLLLDQALELDDANAELWRMRLELARLLGDVAARRLALKRYVTLRPQDDAAQLELILDAIGRYQTLDQRVAAVERMLDNPGAAQLSAALRSRLASLAARGAMELGDAERFSKRVSAAATLDPSNAEAAALMVEFALSRGAGPRQLGEALVGWVRAAPLDAAVRKRLGDLLLAQGAYAQAADQFAVAHQFVLTRPDYAFYGDWVIALAAAGRTADALALLDQVETHVAPQPAEAPAPSTAAPKAAAPGAAAPKAPADDAAAPVKPATAARLPMDLELLRLAILDRAGDTAKADASYARIADRLRKRIAEGDESAGTDRAWLAVLFNRDLGQVNAWLQPAAKHPADDPLRARINGFLALRQRQFDRAQAALGPLAAADAMAMYGLAISFPRSDAQRIERLRQAQAAAPDALAAVLASMDLAAAGAAPKPTPDGAAVAAIVDHLPAALAQPDPRKQTWIALDMDIHPAQYRYLEPITARLTLRNATDWPLAFGQGGSIPSQLFLYVAVRRAGAHLASVRPLVIDMRRRLGLPPRTTMSLNVRLDYGELGSILAVTPAEQMDLSATAVLDPRITASGGMALGPLGASDLTNLINRRGLPPTRDNIDIWLTDVNASDPVQQLQSMARLAQLAPRLGESAEAKKVSRRIGDAMNLRYARLDPLAQAWVARFIPLSPASHELFNTALEVARRSDDPKVRMMYLATQVDAADSPDINASLRSNEPRIVEFTKALALALKEKAKADKEQAEQEKKNKTK